MPQFRPHHLVLILIALMWPSQSFAQAGFQSAYTDINLDECLVLKADDFGASFSCPGYKGFPLYIAEGDLRFFVSYGFGALDEMAAGQTLPPFNTIGEKLEWRLSNKTGDFKPFATILRYYTQSGDGSEPDGQVLVVTKIEEGNTCHVAYIDARLTPNANEEARRWADEASESFDCQEDEIYFIPS